MQTGMEHVLQWLRVALLCIATESAKQVPHMLQKQRTEKQTKDDKHSYK